MELFAVLLSVMAVWTAVGIVLAVAIGRASAAAEHEYQLSALSRGIRLPEDPSGGTPEPDARAERPEVTDELHRRGNSMNRP
ncbi:hypothetical protein [Microbacterium sp. BK668]|uniref:hypothetical protein n=1 Tax=Microbacterium sp. BK668 TaxID=2512118 RepID=UPI00105D00A6|nr:hypothetical protein [Microbacterium sp. BK668]TDN90536.1 hypothetical protein EV279_0023 [Microbacterium sp. BK668]